jgi:hypothetical protein
VRTRISLRVRVPYTPPIFYRILRTFSSHGSRWEQLLPVLPGGALHSASVLVRFTDSSNSSSATLPDPNAEHGIAEPAPVALGVHAQHIGRSASPSPLTTGRAWRGSLATGCGRPSPLSRLARAAHGRLTYEPKHPLDDGTTHLVFEPLELLEKLAVLVPPPREHLVLYSGVLAPCASLRDQVVPPPPPAAPGACSGKRGRPPRRIDCAALLKRVFAVQILACALCGGKMRVISVIEEGPVATKILSHLGLPSAPVRAPARDPPDPELPLPPSTDARLTFAGA